MKKSELERLTKDLKDHLFHENFLSYTIAYCLVHKGTEDGTVLMLNMTNSIYYQINLWSIN